MKFDNNERKLKDIVNNRLIKILIITMILVFFLVLLPAQSFLSNLVFTRIEEIAIDGVFSSLDDFNFSLEIVENEYNKTLETLLRKMAPEVELMLEEDNLTKEDIESEITELLNDTILPADNSLDDLNYYLINPEGVIEHTNYEPDLGLDLSEQTDFWSQLNQLEAGEIALQRLSFEVMTEKPRKYGYLRLENGYILEFGFIFSEKLMNQLNDRIKNVVDSFIFIEQIDMYSESLNPINKDDIELTDYDREAFSQLAEASSEQPPEQSIVKRDLTSSRQAIYIRWMIDSSDEVNISNEFNFKIIMNFSFLQYFEFALLFLAIIISLITGLVIIFFNKHLYNKLLSPFSKLITNMNEFKTSQDFRIEAEIDRTDIKEVNSLLATYQSMVNELSANFEEMEAINQELDASYTEIDNLNNKLEELINLPEKLNKSILNDQYDEFSAKLLKYVFDLVDKADYGSMFLLKDGYWQPVKTIGHKEKLKEIKIAKKCFVKFHNDVRIVDKGNIIIDDCANEIKAEFFACFKAIKETIIAKIKIGDKVEGRIMLDIAKDSSKSFSRQEFKVVRSFSEIATASLTMKHYNELHSKMQKEIIFAIVKILEIHDKYTRGHSENVADISLKLANEMGLSEAKFNDIYWAGLVHDIGKILVKKKVLNKPSTLTDKEYEEIKKHPLWGYQVLNNSEELKEIATFVKYHHERWDGNGYPKGLKEDEIPVVSQILALADAWDTMLSDRVYRSSLSRKVAIKELKDNKGTQFAPQVIEAALRLIEAGNM